MRHAKKSPGGLDQGLRRHSMKMTTAVAKDIV